MKTVAEQVGLWAEEICAQLGVLRGKSHLYRFINQDHYDGVLWAGGDYAWTTLDAEGAITQSRLFDEYRRFSEYLRAILCRQPSQTLARLDSAMKTVLHVVQQDGSFLFDDNAEPHFERAMAAVREQAQLVASLHSVGDTVVRLVPDTNALIFNPALESWTVDGAARFSIVLLPAVLAELDELKINHRNPEVRDKANGVIRKIKEYRRRGSIIAGVPVVAGRIEILAVAVEPDLEFAPSWFDPRNRDDRILAAILEIMRLNPTSQVLLMTGDINMQTKAEYSRIPFCEPPRCTTEES